MLANFGQSLLVVGCGNMGGAILRRWIDCGLQLDAISIVDPKPPADLSSQIACYASIDEVANDHDIVMLGIKPQMLSANAGAIDSKITNSKLVLSILAGTEVATLREALPSGGKIIRVMPNMAASIGKSPMPLYPETLEPAEKQMAETLLSTVGQVEWLERENLMHAVTALSGSGPAFLFRFVDSLAAAGVDLGLPTEQAQRLAVNMVQGAAELAASADVLPGELARRVASPGGTTEAGLDVLDEDAAIIRLMKATLRAARDRSEKMASEARRSDGS